LPLTLPSVQEGRVLFMESVAHNKLNQREQAMASLQKAIAADGSQPRYYSMLLTLQGANGMKGIDVPMLRQAMQRFPTSPELLLLTGLYNLETEEYNSVRQIAGRMDVVAPGSAESQLLRGHLHLVNFEFEEATQRFQGALEKGMDTPHVHHHLGKAQEKRGEFSLALKHYEQALGMDPDRPDLLYDLAQLRLNLGEVAQAALLGDRLLSLDAANARVHKLLADIARAKGEADAVRRHLAEFKRLSIEAQATRKVQ
ncbi:MAG: tetratricopeptide repeat protein, partial [Bryobacterales bacterium]|nr:tetratricopeptide repeat protein [Bryobacterales bacterium]